MANNTSKQEIIKQLYDNINRIKTNQVELTVEEKSNLLWKVNQINENIDGGFEELNRLYIIIFKFFNPTCQDITSIYEIPKEIKAENTPGYNKEYDKLSKDEQKLVRGYMQFITKIVKQCNKNNKADYAENIFAELADLYKRWPAFMKIYIENLAIRSIHNKDLIQVREDVIKEGIKISSEKLKKYIDSGRGNYENKDDYYRTLYHLIYLYSELCISNYEYSKISIEERKKYCEMVKELRKYDERTNKNYIGSQYPTIMKKCKTYIKFLETINDKTSDTNTNYIELINEIDKKDPQDTFYKILTATLYYKIGNTEEAKRRLIKVIASPGNPYYSNYAKDMYMSIYKSLRPRNNPVKVKSITRRIKHKVAK